MPTNLITSAATLELNTSLLEQSLNIFANPLQAATAQISAKYDALGGAAGILGAPDGEISPCPDGQGYFRHFWNNGSIYWSPNTGACAVYGAIREKWASLSWERGFLGYPVTDQRVGRNPQSDGSVQPFQGGTIFTLIPNFILTTEVLSIEKTAFTDATIASTQTLRESQFSREITATAAKAATRNIAGLQQLSSVGKAVTASHELLNQAVIGPLQIARPPKPAIGTTHEVHGAILEKYLALGADSSFCGYPTTDESGTPDGIGRFNHFQAGSIYWTAATGAHEVHGLLREYWSAHGWERNPALGYPTSDELIPDLRIGHVRPETHRKPVLSLPADVLKLPIEAISAEGMPRTALNVMTTAKTFGGASTIDLNLGVLAGFLTPQPASTAAPERSVNRFGDFENGVLFWFRGSGAAQPLAPWNTAADGTVIHKSAGDIVAATMGHLGGAVQLSGGTVMPTFAGTSAYGWDGAGVENRRHQIQVNVMVLAGSPIPLPQFHSVTLFVLVTLEPETRKITGFLTDYATGEATFATRLDPLLWSPFDLLIFPDTNDGSPYSILSVKTMPNGDVNTYIEPRPLLESTVIHNILNPTILGVNQ